MGATTRTDDGRFRSDLHPLELYGIVRAVAIVACPEAPTLASQSAWDAARAEAAYPDAPTARAICMRLEDASGRPFPWRELLDLVFDDSRDVEHTHALRAGVKSDYDLDEGDVYYALRRVAILELGQASLGPDEYRRERERLIAETKRRRNDAHEFVIRALPTVGQIERIAGDWDTALLLADLEPRPTPTERQMMKAIDRVAKPAGYWTLPRCVAAVRRFIEDPAVTGSPSQGRYRAWAAGKEDAPAPSTFDTFGGWATVHKLARRRSPVPGDELSVREQREVAVLNYIDEHGRITAGELRALLGISADIATRVFGELRKQGLIAIGGKHSKGRWVFYVRPDQQSPQDGAGA